MRPLRYSINIITLAAATILLAWTAAHATLPSQASPIGQLSWMAGCWELRVADRHVEEQWMIPRGQLMLGMSRTIVAGQLLEYEQLLIREDSTGLVLRAHPSRQVPTEFRSIELSDSSVTFENLAHDFPQRVMYRSAARGDSLLARVEGTVDGRLQAADFPYARIPCGG